MKSGFVALIGRPNAGKSTLLNALLNQKIAIISPKPQTTRNAIRGIRTDDDSQIVFVDTPGIHKPHHALGANMNKEALSNAGGVDVIYYLVDGSVPFGSGDEYVLNTLKQNRLPVFLVLNKIDLLNKDELMELLISWSKRYDFKEIFPISAKEEDNLDALLKVTKNYLEDGIQYYPSDQVCDYPEQFIMAEIAFFSFLKKCLNLLLSQNYLCILDISSYVKAKSERRRKNEIQTYCHINDNYYGCMCSCIRRNTAGFKYK